MDTKETSDAPKDKSILLTEFSALRDEIVKRLEVEHQLALFTVILLGTILGIGLHPDNYNNYPMAPLIFLYPTLALFLSIGWSHSDNMTTLLGRYIKERIEAGMQYSGWEQYPRHSHYHRAWRGMFISTQLLAIVIGVAVAPLNTTYTVVLLCIAIASLLLTIFSLFYPQGPIKLRYRLKLLLKQFRTNSRPTPEADLKATTGITVEELEKGTKSSQGATIPNEQMQL